MLICEELFLLLRRDDGKSESAMSYDAYGLCGAVISDLLLAERVTLSEGDKDPRVMVVGAAPGGHPVLDAALARLADKDGKKLSSLVTDSKLDPEEGIAASLAEAGVVGIEEKRMLGLVPAKYPTIDPEPERALRERLRVVLAGGTPQPADGVLLAILQGLEMVPTVLKEEKGDLGRKDLKRRVEEVSQEAVAGLAVKKAVETMNVALMTAVMVPAITASTTASS